MAGQKMKKNFILVLTLIVSVFPLFSNEKLSQEHKDWLETVKPIITKIEKEIFLQLKTNEERNRFIQIFWKQRDSMPDTSENEFYKDYMGRVRFSDFNFGRQSSKRGSQTERGYYYLLLGPPLERQIFDKQSQFLPLELWYYKGEVRFGLPPYFYLIFYQPQGIGEYRLYYPGEGPEKLVIPSYSGATLTREQAFKALKIISAELANVSLSYLPGEGSLSMETISSSDMIISNVRSVAEKKFSDEYARTYLTYKDYVETEYSHNFFESSYMVKVFENFGQFFIHWAVEPKKVNFGFYDGKYYAAFSLILKIEDMQGNPVFEREEEISLRITPEQYKEHEQHLFSIQDVLPVISGNYKMFFLLKNKTAKDFTSFQTEVSIPEKNSGPSLSNLLLYHSLQDLGENQRQAFKAFSFEGRQFLFNTENNFLPQEEMGVYCQLHNLSPEDKSTSAIFLLEILSLSASTPVMSQKKPLEEVLVSESGGIEVGPFSLSSFDPGYYHADISILDASGHKVLSKRGNFILLSQRYPVIPWVYSKQHMPFPEPTQLFTLATQSFMTRKYEQAHSYLDQAIKMKDEPAVRLLLGKVLYALHRYQDSLTAVFPVYQSAGEREAAKLIAANYAALEDWSSALIYLEKLMAQATEINVLNLAAECYLNLKQPEKALLLLRKSLQLNPAQPHMRDLEEKIKRQLKIKNNHY
jgi:GWxTD domain-containing protein